MINSLRILLISICFFNVYCFASSSLNNALGEQKANEKPISLHFKNIKVREALQILAQFSGNNIIVSDKVGGAMSLNLNELLWEEALSVILKSRALKMRKINKIIYIFTAKEMANQEHKQELSLRGNQPAPLYSAILTLNYAKAKDLSILLQKENNHFFSRRGSVNVDYRTNALLLSDTKSQLERIKRFVKRLDRPLKQVLIEARIVNINKDCAEELGIRFGLTKRGLVNKETYQLKPRPFREKLNLDFITAPLAAIPAATTGIALAKLSSDILLDLELAALESEGRGEIISSPRLITTSKRPALIESGEEIPYQEATYSGATAISFKKAVLSLKVTPEVTENNSILMNLHLTQDIPSVRVVNGQPSILTKEIKTEVLAKNGQTIVLGGIYKQDKSKIVNKIPILGSLPLIGGVFRNQTVTIKNEELLIFITPRIIEGS